MNWRALDRPHLGKPSRYLEHYHITHRKVFRATWSQKVGQKLTKTQKFRESQLALENKILSFARFLRLNFTSTLRNVMMWHALDSPGLGQAFRYLEHYHITHRKVFIASWSEAKPQKTRKRQNLVFQSQLRLSKFLCFHQFLAHFLTSGGSKNFSMSDMMTFKAFKRLP